MFLQIHPVTINQPPCKRFRASTCIETKFLDQAMFFAVADDLLDVVPEGQDWHKFCSNLCHKSTPSTSPFLPTWFDDVSMLDRAGELMLSMRRGFSFDKQWTIWKWNLQYCGAAEANKQFDRVRNKPSQTSWHQISNENWSLPLGRFLRQHSQPWLLVHGIPTFFLICSGCPIGPHSSEKYMHEYNSTKYRSPFQLTLHLVHRKPTL